MVNAPSAPVDWNELYDRVRSEPLVAVSPLLRYSYGNMYGQLQPFHALWGRSTPDGVVAWEATAELSYAAFCQRLVDEALNNSVQA